MGGVGLGGRESDLTIPECGLAILRDRARELGRLPEEERAAAGAAHDRALAEYLAAPCPAELPIPTREQAAAGMREQVKQEVKQEAAPAPAPAPAPTLRTVTFESDQMWQQLRQAKADTHAAWQANADEAERRREEVLRFKQQLDRRGPPKSPPRQRPPKADVGADAYVAFEEARAAARAAHEAAHAHYLEQRRQLERMLEQLLALYGQEDTLRAAIDAAEDACQVYAQAQLERHALVEALMVRELRVLDLQEREQNARKRAALLAAAEKEWGPDHAVRPPTAVYDLRGPLQPVPPPEQLPGGSWNGGRVPAVMPKQA